MSFILLNMKQRYVTLIICLSIYKLLNQLFALVFFCSKIFYTLKLLYLLKH